MKRKRKENIFVILFFALAGCGEPEPLPVPFPKLEKKYSVCREQEVRLEPGISSPHYLYYWEPAHMFSNPYNLSQTLYPEISTKVVFVAQDLRTGIKFYFPVEIEVMETPRAFAGFSREICEGDIVQIGNPSSSPVYTYQWSPEEGLDDPFSPAPHASPVTTTTYTLTVSNPLNGCAHTDDVTLTVNPLPQANFSSFPACQFDEWGRKNYIIFENLSTGGSDFVWTFGDGSSDYSFSPTHYYASPGIYNVSLSVSSPKGCSSSFSLPVTVYENPVVNILKSSSSLCGPGTVFFNAYVSGGTPPYFYEWDFGDGSSPLTDPSPSHFFSNPGTYTVTLIVHDNNGCGSYDVTEIEVKALPGASFTSSSPQCFKDPSGNLIPVNFTYTGSGAVSWIWDFGDFSSPSTEANPTHIYNLPGTYTVTLTATSPLGCESTYSMEVTVYPVPYAEINLDPLQICGEGKVSFNASPQGGIPPYSVVWDFGDPLTTDDTYVGNSTDYYYKNTGTYSIGITVYDSHCSTFYSKSITVYEIPVPSMIVSSGEICSFESLEGWGYVSGGSGSYKFLWDFGDGTKEEGITFSHAYQYPGEFTISLSVEDLITFCSGTTSSTVNVLPSPIAFFNVSEEESCLSTGFYFLDSSTGTITGRRWEFGDSSFALDITDPFYLYESPGFYEVTLQVTNNYGCTDKFHKFVYALTEPTITDLYILNGKECRSEDITFYVESDGADEFTWDPGDNSTPYTDTSPTYTHSYISPGLYPLTVTASNLTTGCEVNRTLILDITSPPTPNAGTDQIIARGSTTNIGFPAGGGVPPYYYSWTSDPPEAITYLSSLTIAQPFLTTYEDSPLGEIYYAVGVTDSKGCYDPSLTDIVKITIVDGLVALAGADKALCYGETVTIGIGASGGTPPYEFYWDPDYFLSSTRDVPTTANPPQSTTYTLTVTDSSSQSKTDDVTVFVYPSPLTLLVEANPDSLCGKGWVNFSRTITAGTPPYSHLWDFGDGKTSTISSPSHYYSSPSTYLVTLSVQDSNLCPSLPLQATGVVRVFEVPVSFFTHSTPQCYLSPTGNKIPVTFTASPTGPVSKYYYDFGDPVTTSDFSEEPITSYTYLSPGTFTAYLYVESPDGCGDTYFSDVIIYPSPLANFSSPVSSCEGKSVEFLNLSTGASYYYWDFGDGSVENVSNPVHSYSEEGVYTVSLTAYNSYGCSSILSRSIYIYSLQSAGEDKEIFTGENALIGPPALSGYYYFWSSSPPDPSLEGKETYSQVNVEPLSTTIYTLTITDGTGCVTHDDVKVSVYMMVTFSNPSAGYVGYPPNSSAIILFSEKIDPSTIPGNIFLYQISESGDDVEVPAEIQIFESERAVLLKPSAGYFTPLSDYVIMVSTSVKSIYTNSLKNPYYLSFAAGDSNDNIPPQITFSNPVPDATNVATNTTVVIGLSEVFHPGTVGDWSISVTETLTGNSVSGTVSFDLSSRMITFYPSSPLSFNTNYTVRVTGISDLAGNFMADTLWRFTTGSAPDITPPSVIAHNPPDGAQNISLSQPDIRVQFSEAIETSSLQGNFQLIKVLTGESVPGSITYNSSTSTAYFSPAFSLEPLSLYKVVVENIKDLSGNPMTYPFTFTFTTEGLFAYDNFEGSPFNLTWTVYGNCPVSWQITGERFYSPTHAYSDSPFVKYYPQTNCSLISSCINLSNASSATLSFYSLFKIQNKAGSRDKLFVEVRNYSDSSSCEKDSDFSLGWADLGILEGVQGNFTLFNYSLSTGFYIRFRFRLYSDADAKVADGVYIDNVLITGY